MRTYLRAIAAGLAFLGVMGVAVQAQTPGSVGLDFSANAPSLPNVGANFGGSGVYANYVLLATVPAKPNRIHVETQDQSFYQALIVRDDGTAAAGAAPVNASIYVLTAAAAAGGAGGSWSSTTFKGRLQIYGPSSSAQVATTED